MAGAAAPLLIAKRDVIPLTAPARPRLFPPRTRSPLMAHAEVAKVTPVLELLAATAVLSEYFDHN
jgi:hypothetical protein